MEKKRKPEEEEEKKETNEARTTKSRLLYTREDGLKVKTRKPPIPDPPPHPFPNQATNEAQEIDWDNFPHAQPESWDDFDPYIADENEKMIELFNVEEFDRLFPEWMGEKRPLTWIELEKLFYETFFTFKGKTKDDEELLKYVKSYF